MAVKQMTDLIESLLEFSRTRESLHPSHGDVREAVESAIKALKTHPEFQRVRDSRVLGRSDGGLVRF